MWDFILALSLIITKIFNIIMFALGMTYNGKDDGPIFLISVTAIYALALGYIALKEMSNKKKRPGSKSPYFLPLVLIGCYLFEYNINGGMGEASTIIAKDTLSSSAVAIYVGNYCVRFEKIKDILKNIELIAFACSIALLFAIPTMFATKLRAQRQQFRP